MSQQKTARESEMKKFTIYRSGEGTQGVKAGYRQREQGRQDLGYIPLLGSVARVL